MEQPTEANDNMSLMESEDVRLRDIFEILNPNSQSPAMNGMPNPAEARTVTNTPNAAANNLPQSASLPLLGQELTPQILNSQIPATIQQKSVQRPFINIIEQPAAKAIRFRYECEGRSAGSIPGVNSTPENKTFPTIEIVGYKGDVVIVISCVTKDPPYRPHPHKLVGRDGCKDGICSLTLKGEPMRAVFSNLGVQCVKRKQIRSALELREKLVVDPFKTKFGHKDQPSSMDLNVVRLCFQAFIKTASGTKSLTPVVTDPIYDRKAMSDLVICRLCSCAAKVLGGDEVILLCEKVTKDDIKVKFFELNKEKQVVWEDYAEFQQTDIHKQTAIAFKTPRYHNTDIVDRAKVFLQLVRPSDGEVSEAVPFEYHPDPDQIKRKRLKMGASPMNILRRELQRHDQLQNQQVQNDFRNISASGASNFWNTPILSEIKPEPAMSPQNFGPHRSPYQMSPSPQPLSPLNRNATPSPGLLKTPSAGSQTQMCELMNYNSLKDSLNSPPAYGAQYNNVVQNNSNQNNNNNNNGNANAFMQTADICEQNNFVPLANGNGNGNSFNPFMDMQSRAPRMSGGSITPIWPANSNTTGQQPSLFLGMNIVAQQIPVPQQQYQQQQQQYQQQQPYQQQQYQQQQYQQFQQLPNDIDILANVSNLEEGPTLSGLLAMVDADQLMQINSDDLPLSNLSITT